MDCPQGQVAVSTLFLLLLVLAFLYKMLPSRFSRDRRLSAFIPCKLSLVQISFPGLFAVTPLIFVKNSSFDGTVTVTSSRNGSAPPHFATGAKAAANGSVTFTATVKLNSG